jgi:hypothetical protein
MIKFSNKHFWGLLVVCSLVFLLPFVTKTTGETFNSTISTACSIVGTLLAFITLVVGVLLFDRYGFNGKFKEKQLDILLQLVYELKILNITIVAEKYSYYNFIRHCANLELLPQNIYQKDKTKKILIPHNFPELIKTISNLSKNPWMPKEIKERLKFLDFVYITNFDELKHSEFVKLNIDSKGIEPWGVPGPETTLEMLSINFSSLISAIIIWLKNHSNVKIDFDLNSDDA